MSWTVKAYQDFVKRFEAAQRDLSFHWMRSEGDEVDEFSVTPCEICRRREAGARWEVGVWRQHDASDLQTLAVCGDCRHYGLWGDLDELALLDVERDRQRLEADDAEHEAEMRALYWLAGGEF